MKKIIKLTESDIMRIVKRVLKEQTSEKKTLPLKPDGAPYNVADFSKIPLNNAIPIAEVPNRYKSGFFGGKLARQGSDYVDFNNIKTKPFCNGLKSSTLLFPPIVQTYASVALYPPVKFICDPSGTHIQLKPINTRDAELIVRNGGIDYRQESLKHLIKDQI